MGLGGSGNAGLPVDGWVLRPYSMSTSMQQSPEQMLSSRKSVIRALLPFYVQNNAAETKKLGSNASVAKHELSLLATLSCEIKAAINCSDVLGRNFSGPQRNFDIVNVSGRGKPIIVESPQFFDGPEETIIVPTNNVKNQTSPGLPPVIGSQLVPSGGSTCPAADENDIELSREIFRRPRDALLCLSAEFLTVCSPRLKELTKLVGDQGGTSGGKAQELLDQRSYTRLSEVAHSLMKLAPYDYKTMACEGLQKYFLNILPLTDWAQEQNRSAMGLILRRLDKTFQKIGKKGGLRRRTNWSAVASWLDGLFRTINNFPYMAHLHFLKTTVQVCLKLLLGDVSAGADESLSSVAHSAPPTVLSPHGPPSGFSRNVVKVTAILMQALGEQSFNIDHVCGADTLGSNAERIEGVLCHILMPLILRAGTLNTEIPILRQSDISRCTGIILIAMNPTFSKSAAATAQPVTLLPPAASTGKDATRASVSITEKPGNLSVGGSHSRHIRDSVYQSSFLALKILITAFEDRLEVEWHRISRCIRDLGNKHHGGYWLWNFFEFILESSTSLKLLLFPYIKHKILFGKALNEQEQQWQESLRDRVPIIEMTLGRSKLAMLYDLTADLKNMVDDFCNKSLEGHSRTPTILADLASDSSSFDRRASSTVGGGGESRRQSVTTETHRLSITARGGSGSRLLPSPFSRTPGSGIQGSDHSRIEDTVITEEAEGPAEEGEGEDSGARCPLTAPTATTNTTLPRLTRFKSTIRLPKSRRRARRSFQGSSAVVQSMDLPSPEAVSGGHDANAVNKAAALRTESAATTKEEKLKRHKSDIDESSRPLDLKSWKSSMKSSPLTASVEASESGNATSSAVARKDDCESGDKQHVEHEPGDGKGAAISESQNATSVEGPPTTKEHPPRRHGAFRGEHAFSVPPGDTGHTVIALTERRPPVQRAETLATTAFGHSVSTSTKPRVTVTVTDMGSTPTTTSILITPCSVATPVVHTMTAAAPTLITAASVTVFDKPAVTISQAGLSMAKKNQSSKPYRSGGGTVTPIGEISDSLASHRIETKFAAATALPTVRIIEPTADPVHTVHFGTGPTAISGANIPSQPIRAVSATTNVPAASTIPTITIAHCPSLQGTGEHSSSSTLISPENARIDFVKQI